MVEQSQTVFIVDDDDDVRDALKEVVESVGLNAQLFSSAQSFLEAYEPGRSGCLVLDIRMPGMSGLELQTELNKRGSTLPIIYVTGHADVPIAVKALKNGAVDFLQKPFHDQQLLDHINAALRRDADVREQLEKRSCIEQRMAMLTAREREVLDLVVAGNPNKKIAEELGISNRTVEIHRSNAMAKMEVSSLPQLIQTLLQAETRP